MAGFHEKYDLFLTPVLATPPLKTGDFSQKLALHEPLVSSPMVQYAAYTPICNATGQPAMSVLLYWNATGVPLAATSLRVTEKRLHFFRLAAQLEEAQPWANRWPSVSAVSTKFRTRCEATAQIMLVAGFPGRMFPGRRGPAHGPTSAATMPSRSRSRIPKPFCKGSQGLHR